MVFRRLLVLLALLASAAACTLPNDPSRTAAGPSRAGIPTLPRELERDVGAAYPDAALQAYVDRVGQKVVSQSAVSGKFRFVVLDHLLGRPLAHPVERIGVAVAGRVEPPARMRSGPWPR